MSTTREIELKQIILRLFQNPVAAEVTRLKLQEFQRIWSLLTSAATVLKEVLLRSSSVQKRDSIAGQRVWSRLCQLSTETRRNFPDMGLPDLVVIVFGNPLHPDASLAAGTSIVVPKKIIGNHRLH